MNNYELKLERKRERFEELAEKNRAKSAAEYKRADLSEDATGIPFGQPILVGHHSEGRHRRTLERADNAMRRSIEADKKADYYASKAAGVGSGGISSDDPEAVTKLAEKIETAKKVQAQMKAANKIIRSKVKDEAKILTLRAEGFTEANAKALLEPDFCGRVGFAAYQLQNNNANIRRMEKRLEELRQRPTETTTTERDGVTIVENADENRIQLIFDGKPPAEVRQILKSNGFRWSRYNTAWQRHLNAAGRHAANTALGQISYEQRVLAYEAEGMTRSDAQAVADAEDLKP